MTPQHVTKPCKNHSKCSNMSPILTNAIFLDGPYQLLYQPVTKPSIPILITPIQPPPVMVEGVDALPVALRLGGWVLVIQDQPTRLTRPPFWTTEREGNYRLCLQKSEVRQPQTKNLYSYTRRLLGWVLRMVGVQFSLPRSRSECFGLCE